MILSYGGFVHTKSIQILISFLYPLMVCVGVQVCMRMCVCLRECVCVFYDFDFDFDNSVFCRICHLEIQLLVGIVCSF